MTHQIEIQNQTIQYEHKISRRSRGIRLSMFPGGRILVTTRLGTTPELINKFILQKQKWILAKLKILAAIPNVDPATRKQEFLQLKNRALVLAKSRANYFKQIYKVDYKKISIKNHKTLWGSCSRKGNLNFNYKIATLEPIQVDYIIVHELCHLLEFNHSPRFWALVAQTIPNHRQIRQNLRRLGLNLA